MILDVGCGPPQRGDINLDIREPGGCLKNRFVKADVITCLSELKLSIWPYAIM